jgi:hypothetical protein
MCIISLDFVMFVAEIKPNMKTSHLFLIAIIAIFVSCNKAEIPKTDRTIPLIKELLAKLDSTDIYAQRKLNDIQDVKSKITDSIQSDSASILLYEIAINFTSYSIDSSLLYLDKAIEAAVKSDNDSLRINAELKQSMMLTSGGFYVAAREILESTPHNMLKGHNLVTYYNAWSSLYHELYSSYHEPSAFQDKYRKYVQQPHHPHASLPNNNNH